MAFKLTEHPVILGAVVILIIAGIYFLGFAKPQTAYAPGIPAAQTTETNTTDPAVLALLAQKTSLYPRAPEFTGLTGYINTEPLTLASLNGNIVIVDFWTYSCINCIREIPLQKALYRKYKDAGVVIVGVHTPEFDFEKIQSNVQKAVTKYEIDYPVVLDSDRATWSAFKNNYWPRKYVIDMDGFIRKDFIGEGHDEEVDKLVMQLVKEREDRLKLNSSLGKVEMPKEYMGDISHVGSPELYFGYEFARQDFGNSEGIVPGKAINYSNPSKIDKNQIYLSGIWQNNNDNAELMDKTGSIILRYSAKSVNIVADSPMGSEIEAFLDGKPVDKSFFGLDADSNGKIQVKDAQLYNVINGPGYEEHVLELKVANHGFRMFTFTFG